MKRRKISKAFSQKSKNEAEEDRQTVTLNSGPSFADLPSNILVEILLRLSIKRIAVCKCVCKTWQGIISDPEFTKFHFSQVDVCPIIRPLVSACLSRILYLVQLEEEQDFWCRIPHQLCQSFCEPACDCKSDIKLDCKLKLPVRNLELALNDNDDANGSKMSHCLKLKPEYHKYKIVNSCNGLLCLSQPSDNNPVAICNPVTGEFINLPEAQIAEDSALSENFFYCGLGFSPITNQYKVVRFIKQPRISDAIIAGESHLGRLAEVHTLGTESWKIVVFAIHSISELAYPTYLNGAVHWLCFDHRAADILVFNFEKECFQSISQPPRDRPRHPCISLGVLGGCLYICDSIRHLSIDLWVMKHYGIENSWTKVYSIDRLPFGLYQPLKYLNNGALLMCLNRSDLIYYNPRKNGFKYFTVEGFKSKCEVLTHTPSFVSLKDVLAGSNVLVFSISSRCAMLKLLGESKAISLVEEIRPPEIAFDISDESSDEFDSSDESSDDSDTSDESSDDSDSSNEDFDLSSESSDDSDTSDESSDNSD